MQWNAVHRLDKVVDSRWKTLGKTMAKQKQERLNRRTTSIPVPHRRTLYRSSIWNQERWPKHRPKATGRWPASPPLRPSPSPSFSRNEMEHEMYVLHTCICFHLFEQQTNQKLCIVSWNHHARVKKTNKRWVFINKEEKEVRHVSFLSVEKRGRRPIHITRKLEFTKTHMEIEHLKR